MSDLDTVAPGRVVFFHYVLTDDEGQEIDRSTTEPLVALFGAGNVIPGMEKGLADRKVGDKFSITCPPEEAYGVRESGGAQRVPREAFPPDAAISAGMMVTAETQDGNMVPLWITHVADDHVMVDTDHPLAGHTLHFDVEIVSVREASEEEKAHGHPHLPGHAHH